MALHNQYQETKHPFKIRGVKSNITIKGGLPSKKGGQPMHRGKEGERGWIINEHVKQEHDLALRTRGSILSLLSQ